MAGLLAMVVLVPSLGHPSKNEQWNIYTKALSQQSSLKGAWIG